MSWHQEKHTLTISGGVGSFETNHPWRGLLWNVIVEPASFDTLYTLSITDSKGDQVIRFLEDVVPDTEVPQEASTSTNEALEMPVLGTYTFTFSAVSADEVFVVRTSCRDTANYGGNG